MLRHSSPIRVALAQLYGEGKPAHHRLELARIIHEPGRFWLKPLIPRPFLDQVVKCTEEPLLENKRLKLLEFSNNQASLMNNPG